MTPAYFHNGKRLFVDGKVAHSAACCCTAIEPSCERYRGNVDLADVHPHDPHLWIQFQNWGNRAANHFLIDVSDECCQSLDGIYELPIRDYATASDVEWDQFSNQAGMFIPNCLPCHDCFEPYEDETWAVLRAVCGDCSYPYHTSCPAWTPSEGNDIIWTVQLQVWGYHNTVCGTDWFCQEPGSIPKMSATWIKELPSAGGPHNHAGNHVLNLVEHIGPIYATFPSTFYFKDLYCQPPSTIDLYAGEEPPPL